MSNKQLKAVKMQKKTFIFSINTESISQGFNFLIKFISIIFIYRQMIFEIFVNLHLDYDFVRKILQIYGLQPKLVKLKPANLIHQLSLQCIINFSYVILPRRPPIFTACSYEMSFEFIIGDFISII